MPRDVPRKTRPHPEKPKRIDWERVRRDYATGKYTDEELAKLHDTDPRVISRRRCRERAEDVTAWPVDRSKDVQQATAALLMADTVGTIARGSDAAAVLAVAGAVRDVILSHRRDVNAARGVAGRLLTELDATTTSPERLAALLTLTIEGLDEADAAAARQQFRQLMTLPGRIAGMQKLADSMQRLQGLERKAFGIGDDEGTSNPLDTMSERELEAELARLTQQVQGLDARVKASEVDAPVPGDDSQARPAVH